MKFHEDMQPTHVQGMVCTRWDSTICTIPLDLPPYRKEPPRLELKRAKIAGSTEPDEDARPLLLVLRERDIGAERGAGVGTVWPKTRKLSTNAAARFRCCSWSCNMLNSAIVSAVSCWSPNRKFPPSCCAKWEASSDDAGILGWDVCIPACSWLACSKDSRAFVFTEELPGPEAPESAWLAAAASCFRWLAKKRCWKIAFCAADDESVEFIPTVKELLERIEFELARLVFRGRDVMDPEEEAERPKSREGSWLSLASTWLGIALGIFCFCPSEGKKNWKTHNMSEL